MHEISGNEHYINYSIIIFFRFLLQIIGRCVDMIDRNAGITGMESCDFLLVQLSQLLQYITHMFQSGTFTDISHWTKFIGIMEFYYFIIRKVSIVMIFILVGVAVWLLFYLNVFHTDTTYIHCLSQHFKHEKWMCTNNTEMIWPYFLRSKLQSSLDTKKFV